MAIILPRQFSAILFPSLMLVLAGCCANNVCDCADERADAVELRFSSAYRAADLDTIIIKRFPRRFTAATKPDSVTLIRTAVRARDSILLNNNAPFAQTGTAKINQYRYVIRYLVQAPKKKPVVTTAFVIDSIRLRGSLEGNGCCSCYTNTEKVVFAKDSAVDLKRKPYLVIAK